MTESWQTNIGHYGTMASSACQTKATGYMLFLTRGMVYQSTAEKIIIVPEQRQGARPRNAAGHARGATSGDHARLLHRAERARAPAHRPQEQARHGRAADPKWRRAATFRKGQKSQWKSGADFWTDIYRSRNPPRISTISSTNFFTIFLSLIWSLPFFVTACLVPWPPSTPRRGDRASAGEGYEGDASR